MEKDHREMKTFGVHTRSEDLELFKLPDRIDIDKCAIRIRPFQPEDEEQVRELFWVGITVGATSARGAALRGSFTRPNSLILYSLWVLGLYLAMKSSSDPPPHQGFITPYFFLYGPLLGILLCVTSVVLFVAHRCFLAEAFIELARSELASPDLMNIAQHYATISGTVDERKAMEEDKSDSRGRYTCGKYESACAFWVAELLAPDDREPTGYVVGSVGIDSTSIPNEPTTAELRRMTVHPSLQRRGIGRRLISSALAHCESMRHHDIKAVDLVTTGFQSSAVGIYESFGWERVKTDLGAPGRWWLDWYCVHYRLELGDRDRDRVA